MEFQRRKVAAFQEQNCRLSLREALAEFYRINEPIFPKPTPNTPWTELLVHHDVGHVFFGVNTSILDETAGDYWTLLATDLSAKEYLAYAKSPEGKQLLKSIGLVNIMKSLFLGLPLLYRVYIQSRKMTKKWKVRDYQQFMDTPLVEVRRAFNVQILEYEV